MSYLEAMHEIINFISKLPKLLDSSQINQFIELLIEAKNNGRRVFIAGAGRSGLVGKAFAMRLMHMGFEVYVFGETILPAVRKNDIVIVISGSGMTSSSVLIAKTAKEIGAKVIAITSWPESPLGKISDYLLIIPGRTKIARLNDYFVRQILGEHEPLTPLGTLFEISTLVTLDSIIADLMSRLGISEEQIKRRHANIE